jgi:hypothetical protein
VRFAELSPVAPLLAALALELGQPDVDQRLDRFRARPARELERARERRLDLRTGGGAGRSEQDPCQRKARMCLIENVPPRAGDLEPLLLVGGQREPRLEPADVALRGGCCEKAQR